MENPALANEYAVNILKPYGPVNYQSFLWRRKMLAIFNVGNMIVHIVAVPL